MHRVFICYRRDDCSTFAADLQSVLDTMFGQGTVFRDEESAPWGKPWSQELRAALDGATCVLVLIGKRWLTAADEYGRRRLDHADDWVRQEIERSLNGKQHVLPVLFDGVEMPPAEAFPEAIVGLADLQARAVKAADWHQALPLLKQELEALGIHATGNPGSLPTPPPHDPLPALRRQLRAQFRNLITFPGLGAPPLADVHVELEVAWPEREPDALGKRLDARTLSPRQLLQLAPDASVGTTGCWVVLGEPGAGKSTMLRHLAHVLAGGGGGGDGGDGADHQVSECNNEQANLAVYVPLATWALTEHSPFHCVEEWLRGTAGDIAAAGLASRLHELAGPDGEPGRVWLLLDGLDEVAPEHMETTQQRLAALPSHLPNARLVVTSREIGYRALGAPFREARLRPMDEGRRRQFLQRWLGEPAAAEVLGRLATRPQLHSLASNPLLLTMVVAVSREQRELPRTRVSLYRQAISLLLNKEFNLGALKIERPTEARLLLRALALSLQDSEQVAWTQEQLAIRLLDLAVATPRIETLLRGYGGADAFLQQLAKRTGILSPLDGPQAPWQFLHRQFRETLAAEALHAEVEAGRDWRPLVGSLDRETIPRWSDTLGLLCGLMPPRVVLDTLLAADKGATVRALRDVDGGSLVELVEFLLGIDPVIVPEPKAWEPQHHWDGDDLRALLQKGQQECPRELPAVIARLWREVRPAATSERLAWIHWALSSVEVVDRKRFFAHCERVCDDVPKLVGVPVAAGTFLMGSPEHEAERFDDEGQQREVKVPAFWLSAAVVTNADFQRFDGEHDMRRWKDVDSVELQRHPVVNVSWWQAYLYCCWLGDDVRLPSEAEWEYACRAGTTTPFSFGENITPAEVNYDGNRPYEGGKKGEDRQRTVEVGSLPPNGWGLCEMHGNVWEWCQDWLGNYKEAPVDGSACETVGSGSRVLRGGSWVSNARSCRSAYRLAGLPGVRSGDVGFRPASSSPASFTTSPPEPRVQSSEREPKPNQ